MRELVVVIRGGVVVVIRMRRVIRMRGGIVVVIRMRGSYGRMRGGGLW